LIITIFLLLQYAVNCGDDADCTASTCGAILGIISGTDGLPLDWCEYIGDRIITVAIDGAYRNHIPHTCTNLTERVMELIPSIMKQHGVYMEFCDDEEEYDGEKAFLMAKEEFEEMIKYSSNSFIIDSVGHTKTLVEYDRAPDVKSGDEFRIKLTFKNRRQDPRYLEFKVYVPDGWDAQYKRSIHIPDMWDVKRESWEVIVNVGENVEVTNDIIIKITSKNHPMPILVPVVLMG